MPGHAELLQMGCRCVCEVVSPLVLEVAKAGPGLSRGLADLPPSVSCFLDSSQGAMYKSLFSSVPRRGKEVSLFEGMSSGCGAIL